MHDIDDDTWAVGRTQCYSTRHAQLRHASAAALGASRLPPYRPACDAVRVSQGRGQ